MAATVQPLQPVKFTPGPATSTPEQLYWESFSRPVTFASPNNYAVTNIATALAPINNLTTPTDLFAATSGTRLQFYSIRGRKATKTISRFTDLVHGVDIRRDGRVVVAGDESGVIQVFDVGSRAILRTWKQHDQGVWVTKFNPQDVTSILSASDDRSVRLWDLPSEEPLSTLWGHEDYVRCADFMPGAASGLVVSGSYDSTVRIWDPRSAGSAVMTFQHDSPVESVLPMPSGSTIVSAAGPRISILDLVGARVVQSLHNHQKTVTSLCLASNDTRMLSGALDGHVKVFETAGWNNVYGTKYPSPVLAVAVIAAGPTREDRHLVVGQESGTLAIRTRLSGEQKIKERQREKEMQALVDGDIESFDRKAAQIKKQKQQKPQTSGLARRDRGLDFNGEGADIIIDGRPPRAPKLKPWDRALHQGKYGQALDLVLETRDRTSIVTLLTALRHRSALRSALSNRDEVTLQPLYKWLCKYIIDARFVHLCVDVALILLDLYAAHSGESHEFDRITRQLHAIVRHEVERSQQACQTIGMMDMLLASHG